MRTENTGLLKIKRMSPRGAPCVTSCPLGPCCGLRLTKLHLGHRCKKVCPNFHPAPNKYIVLKATNWAPCDGRPPRIARKRYGKNHASSFRLISKPGSIPAMRMVRSCVAHDKAGHCFRHYKLMEKRRRRQRCLRGQRVNQHIMGSALSWHPTPWRHRPACCE